MFQPEIIQSNIAQVDVFGSKPPGLCYPTPFSGPAWMTLSGLFTNQTESVPQFCSSSFPRKTLRCRFSDPIRVIVQKRPIAIWEDVFDHTGMEFSKLFKFFGGSDIKIILIPECDTSGSAELIEAT